MASEREQKILGEYELELTQDPKFALRMQEGLAKLGKEKGIVRRTLSRLRYPITIIGEDPQTVHDTAILNKKSRRIVAGALVVGILAGTTADALSGRASNRQDSGVPTSVVSNEPQLPVENVLVKLTAPRFPLR